MPSTMVILERGNVSEIVAIDWPTSIVQQFGSLKTWMCLIRKKSGERLPAALDLFHCGWVHYSYYYKSVLVLELLTVNVP